LKSFKDRVEALSKSAGDKGKSGMNDFGPILFKKMLVRVCELRADGKWYLKEV
jgi:hypothetical protein